MKKKTVAAAIQERGETYSKPASVDGLVSILKMIFNEEKGPLMPLRLETTVSHLYQVLEMYHPMFLSGQQTIRVNARHGAQNTRWGSTTQRGLEGAAEIFGYDFKDKIEAKNDNPHRDRQIAEVEFVKRKTK
jgi:hypothetical protein